MSFNQELAQETQEVFLYFRDNCKNSPQTAAELTSAYWKSLESKSYVEMNERNMEASKRRSEMLERMDKSVDAECDEDLKEKTKKTPPPKKPAAKKNGKKKGKAA